MKKLLCFILMITVMLSFAACGKGEDSEQTPPEDVVVNNDSSKKTDTIDVDLTQLSSTMIYSEVYNMLTNPSDYIDKTVKMKGQFSIYQDQTTGYNYYAVIIADATACCSQGLEFVLAGAHTYPDDYPEVGTEITVKGTFRTYDENGQMYCHLINAQMV